jgi:hypothetical protein
MLRPKVFVSLLPPLAVLLISGVRGPVRRPLLPDQGSVVGTTPTDGFGGGQHKAFPTDTLQHEATWGITNVGLAIRRLLSLVVTLTTPDSRRHPAIPFPQQIRWST